MTSDGTNTYKWDAENRLIEIDYPGASNFSQFSYDGLSQRTKIVETVSGSVTSTKLFIWAKDKEKPSELRDGASVITALYFDGGQTIGGTLNKFFYATDHVGSVRELSNNSGNLEAQYAYDSYGQRVELYGSTESDFQYAGYYFHSPSALSNALYRTYNAAFARWISRDPIGEFAGANLYAYVKGNPISFNDPLGLFFSSSSASTAGGQSDSNPVSNLYRKWQCACENECTTPEIIGTGQFDACVDSCMAGKAKEFSDPPPQSDPRNPPGTPNKKAPGKA